MSGVTDPLPSMPAPADHPLDAPPPASGGPSWVQVLGFWVALGLLESAKAYALWSIPNLARSWRFVLVGNMPWWLLWALLTPVVFAVARRFPLGSGTWRRSLPVHVVAGAALASVHLLLEGAIYFRTHGHYVHPSVQAQWRAFFGTQLVLELVTYALVVSGYTAFVLGRLYRETALRSARSEAHAARLQLGLAEARMHALRMELNPHFLFNTLNSISGLIRTRDDRGADAMVVNLAELLRAALARGGAEEIPLRDELALLGRYVDIERTRFADRLTCELWAAPDTADALLPPLLLQPLVENAVRHGIARHEGPGRVRVTAERRGAALVVEVFDTGAAARPAREDAPAGVGLANVRERLQAMYGTAASLTLDRRGAEGTTARVTLPFHVAPWAAGPRLVVDARARVPA